MTPPLTDDVVTRLRALAANAVAENENVERVSKDSNARMGDVNVAALHRTKAVIKMQSAVSPQTILTLLDRISEADAKCAVLVEATTPTRTYTGEAPTVVHQTCKICHQDAYDHKPLGHAPDCPLQDLPAAAQSLLEKHGWMEAQSNYFENECKELKARISELEAALKPFSDLGRELGDGVMEGILWPNDTKIEGASVFNSGTDYFMTVGDLRKAAKSIHPTTLQGESK